MSNARKIYEQIVNLDYVQQYVIGKRPEDTWLDCKRKNHPENGSLDEKDKSNFAKALSGFANTSGGVLIFGLDARQNSEGIDIVQDFYPISNLNLFESELREFESRIVERAIPGLEYKKILIDENKDNGIIVIYIPEGPNPPYRSLVDNKFYVRTGDSFGSIEVSQIEGLVLKKIRPDLDIKIFVKFENIFLDIYFQLTNIGHSIAKYILLELRFMPDYEFILEPSTAVIDHSYKREVDPVSREIIYKFYLEKAIHPTESSKTPIFRLLFKENQEIFNFPFIFELSIYSENMPKKVYSINVDHKRLMLINATSVSYQLERNRDFH